MPVIKRHKHQLSPEGSEITSQGSGITKSPEILLITSDCPQKIIYSFPEKDLAAVDRLEILIGGRRAGNNSVEIINEIEDICERLFTSGIMDANIYSELIDEITDVYSD